MGALILCMMFLGILFGRSAAEVSRLAVQQTCNQLNVIGALPQHSNHAHICCLSSGTDNTTHDNFICGNVADAKAGGVDTSNTTCGQCPVAFENSNPLSISNLQQTCNQIHFWGGKVTYGIPPKKRWCCMTPHNYNFICLGIEDLMLIMANQVTIMSETTCVPCASGIVSARPPPASTLNQTCSQLNHPLGEDASPRSHCCMSCWGDNFICVNDTVADDHGMNKDEEYCSTCPDAIMSGFG